MKASDHKEVGELLQDLELLKNYVECDYIWELHLVIHRDWKRTIPDPISKIWEDTRGEAESIFKNRLASRIRRMEYQLRELGVDLREGDSDE